MRGRTLRDAFGFLLVVAMAPAGPLAGQEREHPPQRRGPPDAVVDDAPNPWVTNWVPFPWLSLTANGQPFPWLDVMRTHRERLGLSDAQLRRLEPFAAEQRRSAQRLVPQARRAMADLRKAASGDIDVDAARAAHDRLARIHSEMLATNLRAMKEARQVLTPEQRARWDAMMDERN